jgi:hypothetical protein
MTSTGIPKNVIFLSLGASLVFLSGITNAFQLHPGQTSSTVRIGVPNTFDAFPTVWHKEKKSQHLSRAQRLWSSPTDHVDVQNATLLAIRDRIRDATGFSFTVFRATLRGITGISLTAIYASTVAATGLWIRKISSVILSVFPAWFRYFLQPLLVLYYAPLFVLRNLTGPTRRRAVKQHESIIRAWKEAVEYARKTERNGYWPVVVNSDGFFEMVAPPDLDDRNQMADAFAETVEHAMEINDTTAGMNEKKQSF